MHPKTVLIVEDNLSVLAAYVQILESLSMDTIPMVAPTYEKARRIFSMETVDLVILDLVLPDVISTDILQEIREGHPGIPIFLVTGYPELVDMEKVEAFHVKNVIKKPFDALALIQALQGSLLEREHGTGPAEISDGTTSKSPGQSKTESKA
jgi:DNA-binding NtrC family response regulator